jgi:hypothetical protein
VRTDTEDRQGRTWRCVTAGDRLDSEGQTSDAESSYSSTSPRDVSRLRKHGKKIALSVGTGAGDRYGVAGRFSGGAVGLAAVSGRAAGVEITFVDGAAGMSTAEGEPHRHS